MPEVIQYFLKLSVSITAVYLFYWLILRKLTFYNWNRWYLMIYSMLCFYIAFADITPMLEKNELSESTVLGYIPVVDLFAKTNKGFFANFDRWDWVSLFFYAGIVFMVARLIVQYVSFYRLKKSAQLLSDKPVRLYQVNKAIIPFSFGNSIFINQEQHSEVELREIIRHEFIHVKQQHSVDVLIGELVCLLNWYNPFAWMMRKAIRQNLEFIADRQVLNNGLDKKQYQYLLLKVVGVSAYSVGNQFNFSSLKKRIMMMNKIRSAKVHLIRFLFILPMIAILLVSFRKNIEEMMVHDLKLKPDGSGQFADLVLEPSSDSTHGREGNRIWTNVYFKDTLVTVEGSRLSKGYIVAVNGKVSNRSVLKTINPSSVSEINYLTGKNASAFGEAAKVLGVLSITTSSSVSKHLKLMSADTIPAQSKRATVTIDDISISADTIIFKDKDSLRIDASLDGPRPNMVRVRGYGVPGQEPLYVIDGVVQNSAYDINKLKGDDIQSITVIKDKTAMDIYGTRAVNGVLEITTKAGKVPPSSWKSGDELKLGDDFGGVYIIEGKQYSNAEIQQLNIDPNDIESINVWKNATAVSMFGERGKFGVIEITMKKGVAVKSSIVRISEQKKAEIFEQARKDQVLFVGENNPVRVTIEASLKKI